MRRRTPGRLIDLTRLPGLDAITIGETGATIGALATMSRVAEDEGIRSTFRPSPNRCCSAASAQLRNMATIGGNLLQRTRCAYFRDPAGFPACNKRDPGTGCSAHRRRHPRPCGSRHQRALHRHLSGDLAVALTAWERPSRPTAPSRSRSSSWLPGTTPERETVLEPGEIITSVTIPASPLAANSTYLKVRDRQSYEFAAASAAVGLELEADGVTIRDIRVALGGVATKPWRAMAVEDALARPPPG